MCFENDLALGNSYEMEALKYIQPSKYTISKGKFKPYDIKALVDDQIIYYEVKSDRLMNKSGNFCIEYMSNGKDSGISSTQADYYVYFSINTNTEGEDECFIIPVDEIKKAIKENKFCGDIKGGDNYRSKFKLFKRDIFSEYEYFLYN